MFVYSTYYRAQATAYGVIVDRNKSGTLLIDIGMGWTTIKDVSEQNYHSMQTHSITLGMNIKDAGTVTNQMWIQFLNDTVLASLEYATITDAMGIYKGTIEKSKVISVSTDDTAVVESLLEVGDAYKKAFNQDAIMYTVLPVPLLQFT